MKIIQDLWQHDVFIENHHMSIIQAILLDGMDQLLVSGHFSDCSGNRSCGVVLYDDSMLSFLRKSFNAR